MQHEYRAQKGWPVTMDVLMDYTSPTSNSFEKCSNMFFLSLFSVWLSILLFHVKLEQLNVNKWPK